MFGGPSCHGFEVRRLTQHFHRIERDALRLSDERGHIDILYESDTAVLKRTFSKQGVLRGLHWQDERAPQAKIFRVIEGSIVDFVVDMSDPEHRLHHSEVGPQDGWIAIGPNFAHAFYAMTDTVFEYFCDGGYDADAEHGFNIVEAVRRHAGGRAVHVSSKDAAAAPLGAMTV